MSYLRGTAREEQSANKGRQNEGRRKASQRDRIGGRTREGKGVEAKRSGWRER